MKLKSFFLGTTVCGLVMGHLQAEDEILPGNGFPASRYEALWTKSPFAVATPEAGQESPDYALKGVAQFDGVSYASLIDKKSQEHFLLATDKPARGLKLISITRSKDAGGTLAVIEGNGQTLTLKLDMTEAAPPPNAATINAPVQNLMPNSSPGGGGIMTTPANPAPPPVILRPRLIHPPPQPGTQAPVPGGQPQFQQRPGPSGQPPQPNQ